MLENKSVKETISLIKSREISVKEVVQFYLERIYKYNQSLNAIISKVDEKKILDEANEKDKKKNLNENKQSLFGLPMAVKEFFDVDGLKTSYCLFVLLGPLLQKFLLQMPHQPLIHLLI